jgi:hypothetical protein
MTIPQWAAQFMQSKINEGNMDYNSLGESARSVLTPMSEEAKQAQVDAQAMQNIDQADQTAKNQRIVNGVDPALANVTSAMKEQAQLQADRQASIQRVPEFIRPVFQGLGNLESKFVDPILTNPWISRAGQTGGEVQTMVDNPNKVDTGSGLGNTTADLLGGLMGFVGNPTGGVESLGANLWKGGENLVRDTLPLIGKETPKLAQEALKVTGATIPYELTNAYANDRPVNPAEMGTAVGANVLLSALTHGLGKLGKGATRVESAVNGAIQPQYRDVAPILNADQGLSEAGSTVNPISVNRVDTALPEYQVGISDNVPLGKGANPNISVAPDANSGQVLYRGIGDRQNNLPTFLSDNKDYASGFGKDIQEYQLNGNEKIADFTTGSNSYSERLAELGIPQNKINEALKSSVPQKSVDELLKEQGYDVVKMHDEGNNGKLLNTYQLLYPEKYQPLGKGAVPNGSVAADMGTPSAQMTIDLGKGANPTASLIPQRPIRVPGVNSEVTTADGLGKGTPPGQVAQTNQYVDTSPIDINMGKNDKATSTDIRQGYVGKLNKQIVTGNQLRDTIQKLAPKEQMGIQLFIDAGGDINHLQEMAQNMNNVDANGVDSIMDSFIPNTKTTYREAYNQALNLSPEAQKAAQLAQQYYKEAGQYSLNMGSTKGVLEDYANRAWKQPPSGTVKTEVGKSGLSPYTSHSKERVYNTIGEGILNGKEPATLNAGDLLSIHNQEMARVNTNRALADSLTANGLGALQFEKPQQGFTAIDSMGKDIPTMHDGKPAIIHQSFVIPDGIAKGLKAITEPDYTKKIDAIRHLQAYQGVVKTVDLSFSLFHHITLAAQALYNSKGGVDFIKNWNNMSKLGSDSFNAAEQWGAQHGLMTTKIDDNMDVVRQLAGKESLIGKSWNSSNPAIKAVSAPFKGLAEVANKNTEFLFGKIQRWLKVTDFQNKAAKYVGKNPNMQNAEVTKGLRQIASSVNDAYGGLNWKAIGVTPTVQSIARLGFLAPDWTFSSARMLGKAFTKGPGGNAARSQFAVGIIGGAILTEGLNHLLTGHYTDKNPKGHELEVEVQPGVYISLFRSGIGDVTKWSANMLNQGVLGGTINTLQGKASPLIRTAVGQLANKQFTGAPITSTKNTPLGNDWARLKEVGNSFAPVPFGVSGTGRYLKGGEATPLGTGLVSTGAGRYSASKPLSSLADPASAYAGNWLNDLTSPSSAASDALIGKISAQSKAQVDNTKKVEQELGKALTTGSPTTDVFNRNNVPMDKRSELFKSAKDTMATGKLSPLAQKFQGLSREGQQQLLKTLTPDERATLGNVKLKTK